MKNILFLLLIGWVTSVAAETLDDFFIAVKLNDTRTLTKLLQKGFPPDAANATGDNALTTAAREGSTEVLNLLLSVGADPNMPNQSGETALMLAAYNGYPAMAKALLAKGAEVNRLAGLP